MSWLKISQKEFEQPAQHPAAGSTVSLEELLDEALRYGKPYLHCSSDKTFSCNIEMWINASNAEFKVKSGFDHKTPYSAVNAAVKAARKALQELGGKV